jgi:hypothetical protein
VEEGHRPAEATGAVAQQLDLHALRLPGQQGLGELAADGGVVQDVGFHVDVVARRGDGAEPGAIVGRAVLQQAHRVARGQRAAGDGLLQREMAAENVGRFTAALQTLQDGAALRGGQRAARALPRNWPRRSMREVGDESGQAAAAQTRQAGCDQGRAQPEDTAEAGRDHRDPADSAFGEKGDR